MYFMTPNVCNQDHGVIKQYSPSLFFRLPVLTLCTNLSKGEAKSAKVKNMDFLKISC